MPFHTAPSLLVPPKLFTVTLSLQLLTSPNPSTYATVVATPPAASVSTSTTQPTTDHALIVQRAYRTLDMRELWTADRLILSLHVDATLATTRLAESIRRAMDEILNQCDPVRTPPPRSLKWLRVRSRFLTSSSTAL